MKVNDVQLGKPTTIFKGTTVELAALSAVEGMIAYDETLNKQVIYDGTSWVEIGGSLTVQEVDTSPSVSDVSVINITNGTLTDDGGGEITIDFGSAATDGDAIHDNEANEISAVTAKASPVSGDLLIIEDSEASYVKKSIQIGNLPGGSGTDDDAIHDNVTGEINAITEKTTPIDDDILLLEDSAASYAKKKVKRVNFLNILSKPISTDFTWANQGTASVVDNSYSMTLIHPAANSNSLLYKSAPSTPYSITIKYFLYSFALNYGQGGLVFRQSSDGKYQTFGWTYESGFGLITQKYTTAAYNSTYVAKTAVSTLMPWLKITDNGTNRICYYSYTGDYWKQFHSVGRTDYLTADQVGIFCGNDGTNEIALDVQHWAES